MHFIHRPRISIAVVAVMLVGSAGTATAQTSGFFSANGVFATTSDFSDSAVFTKFVEQGELAADYGSGNAPSFDVGGGVRLGEQFGLGVSVTAFSTDGDADVTATVPHPLYFNRDRQVAGALTDVTRQEIAVHVQASWMVPVNEQLEVAVFGGPTFFRVKQDLVNDVLFSQVYPFDTATFTGATTGTPSKSTVGFNVGADVAYYFSERIGVGFLARFSRATADLPSIEGATVGVDAGGLHTGGGLRIRF